MKNIYTHGTAERKKSTSTVGSCKGQVPYELTADTSSVLPPAPRWQYLVFLDDVYARLDVGEGVHGGEDGLALVLLVQLAARPPALGEGCGVHEAPQVEVLLEVGQSVFHLIVVKEGLHKGDLDVGLVVQTRQFNSIQFNSIQLNSTQLYVYRVNNIEIVSRQPPART